MLNGQCAAACDVHATCAEGRSGLEAAERTRARSPSLWSTHLPPHARDSSQTTAAPEECPRQVAAWPAEPAQNDSALKHGCTHIRGSVPPNKASTYVPIGRRGTSHSGAADLLVLGLKASSQRNTSRCEATHCAKGRGSRPRISLTVGKTVVSSIVPSTKKLKKASTYSGGIAALISVRASSLD